MRAIIGAMVAPAVKSQEQIQARLTPAERDALEALRADQLRSLILYGSKARGESQVRSDLDLLIVYDHLSPL
jgi:predicted nucleotidyltransferase